MLFIKGASQSQSDVVVVSHKPSWLGVFVRRIEGVSPSLVKLRAIVDLFNNFIN